MLSALVLGAVTCRSFGLRPEHSAISQTASFAKLGLTAAAAQKDPSKAIQDIGSAVDAIMLQTGNATEHLEPESQQMLQEAIGLLEQVIFASLTVSHGVDQNEIGAVVADINACNSLFAARLAQPGGDLWQMSELVSGVQTQLDESQNDVDETTEANNTKWSELSSHMAGISGVPECPGLPGRNKQELDLFFQSSQYKSWYESQKASYWTYKTAFEEADEALGKDIQQYNEAKGKRDVDYCAWSSELLAGCDVFNACYEQRSGAYQQLTAITQQYAAGRRDAYSAGMRIIAQINFLLGLSTESEPPTDIDTSAYVLEYPAQDAQGLCGLEVLDDEKWFPPVECSDAAAPGKPSGP